MASFSDFIASFNADAGTRGKQFEHFVKWFLVNDPEWSTQVKKIWLWNEYPGRWGVDCGIDLVFEHKNGEHWAVQAKCYAPEYDITKHDVDKFLSESNRKGIDKRLLIATTDGIGSNAKQVCEAQEKSVIRYMLSNFESANIEYPTALDELNTAKKKSKPEPREHQLEAIDSVVTKFHDVDRGQLIMACGTGKTFTALWIKEKLNANSTLILLPSLGLLSQTLNEWTLAENVPFDVLCVCSDATVGTRNADEAIHSVSDVAFPVTSTIDAIQKFLIAPGKKVVFCTYQSSSLIAEAQKDLVVPAFDLTIADEAHRCAGNVGNDFATVLDEQRLRSHKRLFVTATPRTYSTRIKEAAGERGIHIVGMDDEKVFGKVLYSLPFGQAIKRGLLTDYQVVIIGVDNPTIASWIEKRELVTTNSGIQSDAKALASQIGLLKALKDYDLRRIISFHSRVNRAELFAKDILDVMSWIGEQHKPSGILKTDFVSGEMPTHKRQIKLSKLKSISNQERGLLTNARCLSEGVDVPSLDGVAFIDPRSSQIDILQAVGRAIRLSPSKTVGMIILPVFIDDNMDAASAIEASHFKPIWEVLNALKAHDDLLSEHLDHARTEMGYTGNATCSTRDLSKICFDLPCGVPKNFEDSLRTRLVENVTDSWDYWFGLLKAFVDEHGDAKISAKFKIADGQALGNWVQTQRQNEKSLTLNRKIKLESLTGWTWDAHSAAWDKGFQHLTSYIESNNSIPKNAYVTSDGFRLSLWITTQRAAYSKKKLSPERVKQLEALAGWVWAPHSEAWQKGFQHLANYIKANNSLPLSSYVTEDGMPLGQWTSMHRRSRTRKKLLPSQVSSLESLAGWTWDAQLAAWNTGFQYLSDHLKIHGEQPSTFYVTSDGFRLGPWTSVQRTDYARKKLLPERVKQLEALAGWTWTINAQREEWGNAFQHLSDYLHTHGKQPSTTYVTPSGFSLGRWAAKQRGLYSSEKLPAEKIICLNNLKGWVWGTKSETWNNGFKYLVDYLNTNTSLPPSNYVCADGFPLGRWTRTQRLPFSAKRLSAVQTKKLEDLNVWSWWDADYSEWDNAFQHLSGYLKLYGEQPSISYVTSDGLNLDQWTTIQRTDYAREKLLPERVKQLEALAGWTWTINAEREEWDNAFQHLSDYLKLHGKQPSTIYVTPSGFNLGRWVAKQRLAYISQKLPVDKIIRLNDLKDWAWNAKSETWNNGFKSLVYYLNTNSRLPPSDYVAADGFRLGPWIATQRNAYSYKRLSPAKIKQLEDLENWVWNSHSAAWDNAFQHLSDYLEAHKHLPSNAYTIERDFNLNQWVRIQRYAYKYGRLSAERAQRLENLEGWTWAK